jgi:hypothetical protein
MKFKDYIKLHNSFNVAIDISDQVFVNMITQVGHNIMVKIDLLKYNKYTFRVGFITQLHINQLVASQVYVPVHSCIISEMNINET